MQAPIGQEFVFRDGSNAQTLNALYENIQTMPLDEFQAFVTETKNDFASWVDHALGEKLLAERLRAAPNREVTLLKIREKLDELKAQENLYSIASTQAGTKTTTTTEEVNKNAGTTRTRRALIVKELIIGIILGLVLGFFLDRIIITLIH